MPVLRAIAAPTQLLSIVGLGVPAGHYVSRFDIQTWGVRVLAVCHVPPGWTVTAGKDANPGGVLSGSASDGVTFLDPSRLGQLTGLFLVQVDGYHADRQGDCDKDGWCLPATFAGTVDTGAYGSDADPKPQPLLPSNIGMVAQPRCPDPG